MAPFWGDDASRQAFPLDVSRDVVPELTFAQNGCFDKYWLAVDDYAHVAAARRPSETRLWLGGRKRIVERGKYVQLEESGHRLRGCGTNELPIKGRGRAQCRSQPGQGGVCRTNPLRVFEER